MLAIVSRSNSHSKRPTEKQKYNTKSTWKSHKPYSRFFPLDIQSVCVFCGIPSKKEILSVSYRLSFFLSQWLLYLLWVCAGNNIRVRILCKMTYRHSSSPPSDFDGHTLYL